MLACASCLPRTSALHAASTRCCMMTRSALCGLSRRIMRHLKLTQGYYALVDDEDYERVVAAGPWHAGVRPKTVYAVHTRLDQGKLYLHRFILCVDNDNLEV